MKALGLLLGAGVLALAAGQADATISLYIGQGASGPAVVPDANRPGTVVANGGGSYYYSGTDFGINSSVTAKGYPVVASPNLLTNSINIASAIGGTISYYLVQSDVTALTGALTSSFTTNSIVTNPLSDQATSVSLATFYSATDPFATGSLVATPLSDATFTSIGAPKPTTNSLNGVKQPFYEVTKYTVSFGSTGGSINSTINLSAGAVPEPASWAMMLVGFGVLGAALRRRRPMAANFG